MRFPLAFAFGVVTVVSGVAFAQTRVVYLEWTAPEGFRVGCEPAFHYEDEEQRPMVGLPLQTKDLWLDADACPRTSSGERIDMLEYRTQLLQTTVRLDFYGLKCKPGVVPKGFDDYNVEWTATRYVTIGDTVRLDELKAICIKPLTLQISIEQLPAKRDGDSAGTTPN